MKRNRISGLRPAAALILLLFLLCPCTPAGAQEEKPAYTIREGHPRVFLCPERIQDIRRRCADKRGAQASYYGALKDFADRFTPDGKKPWHAHCLCLAFVYALGEVPGYRYGRRSVEEIGRLGVEQLLQLHPPRDLDYFRRQSPDLIACYDWLFPVMTAEERARVFESFTAVCDKMREAARKEIGNRFRGTRETFAYYGLAFHGDGKAVYPNDPGTAAAADRKAGEYCDFFASYFRDNYFVVLETACKGGNYPDGTMYGESPHAGRIWPLDMWGTASTDPLYEDHTFLTGLPLAWLYQAIPYRTSVRYDNANGRVDQPWGLVRFGDYRYIGHTNALGPRINIAQAQGVAARSGDKQLASVFNWFLQQRNPSEATPFGGPFPTKGSVKAGPQLVWDLLFRDGLVEARSPREANLPLAHLFGSVDSGPPLQPDFPQGRPEGTGTVVMRSSWEDPGGTLIWFKASSHLLSHSHRDQGSFQIYKKGWLAIDSGQYEETPHRGNYAARTVAHNSILVYRPGEDLDPDSADPVWYGHANDGGQRWVPYVTTAAEARDVQHYLGGVDRFESVPGVYDYVHADITRAYNCPRVTTEGHEPKVSRVTRTLVFLRPDEFLVVLDRVHSTSAEYPKRWLLHSIYRPGLDGKETFEGIVPGSKGIPGKPGGVPLQGDIRGGISQSLDTSLITLRGWNLGPSEGRLLCRTLLPERRITRIVGGADPRPVRKTRLAQPYEKGRQVAVENAEGFEPGDFVYLGETDAPYWKGTSGRPCWPVDDVFYRGYGNILKVDSTTGTVSLKPYRSFMPKLPAGTAVVRSDRANGRAFEFMDAEYTQWPMQGESVANAGPFHMQHGSWRVEVEPLERRKEDVFLHVLYACDSETLEQGRESILERVKLAGRDGAAVLEVTGKNRVFRLTFEDDPQGDDILVRERKSDQTILSNTLTRAAIKERASWNPVER